MAEPKYVLWKKYGFRHIEREDGLKALCGNPSWQTLPQIVEDHKRWAERWGDKEYSADLSEGALERPLCGTCRNIWKKKTGEGLA